MNSHIDRNAVIQAFDRYVAGYNADDPKIKLKIEHTHCVASLCEQIGRAVGAESPDLAWLCGMLHDIGRFEQIQRYGTFIDAASVDHALLGADLLFVEGLVDSFAPRLTAGERRALEVAIRNHNAYRIDDGLSEAEEMYCHILRDADKLDIFRVDCETPREAIYNVTTEALRVSAVTEPVKDCFRNRTTVERTLKQTPADFVVSHICLVFELVYPVSRELARKQGYVDRMLEFESENEDTRQWFDAMRRNIWNSAPRD